VVSDPDSGACDQEQQDADTAFDDVQVRGLPGSGYELGVQDAHGFGLGVEAVA
jgi:hypothetical protein